MSGWIKLHRQFKANGHFNMPDRALKIWLYILMTVSHKDRPVAGLKAGEGWISYEMIAEDCGELGKTVRPEAIARELKWLEDNGYITREVTKGKGQKIAVPNWVVYQAASETEVQAEEVPEVVPEVPPEEGAEEKQEVKEPKEPREPKKVTPLTSPQGEAFVYPPEFETFWSVYPRKLRKRDAFRRWVAAQKRSKDNTDPATAHDLQRAAEHYATACQQNGTETRYIMHPSTFLSLRSRAWEDYADGIPDSERLTPVRLLPRGDPREDAISRARRRLAEAGGDVW